MPTTQEIPTTSPIGRDTPRVDGPLKVTGMAQYTSDFHFPGTAVCRAGRSDDRQRQSRHNSTRPRPRKCPACARFFIARTSERSSARSWDRDSKASAKSGARRSRTMSFATTASTSRWPWRTRSRPPRPPPMRFASTYAKEKPNVETDLKADDEPDVVATTFGPRHRLRKPARRRRGRFRERAGQARPDLCHAGRDAQPPRVARDDRDLGRTRR